MITSVGRWAYNQLFYPPVPPAAPPLQPLNVVRVQQLSQLSPKQQEEGCCACLETFSEQEIQGEDDQKWVVAHPGQGGLIHPMHVECLQQWEQAHDPLQCPPCRRPLNPQSIQHVLGLAPLAPPPPAPPTLMQRIARDISRIVRLVWRQMPALLVLGCLPVTGSFTVFVIIVSAVEGTLFPGWKLLLPSAIGSAIGVFVATVLSHLLFNACFWLFGQTNLRPRPITRFIAHITLGTVIALTVGKMMLLVAPLFSQLFLQLALPAPQISQGLKFLNHLLKNATYTEVNLTSPEIIAVARQAWAIFAGTMGGVAVGIFIAFVTNRVLERSRIHA